MSRKPIHTMTPRGGRLGLEDDLGYFQVDERQHVIELLPELKQYMVELAEHSRAMKGGNVDESVRIEREEQHFERAMRLHSDLENYGGVVHLTAQGVDHDVEGLNVTRAEVEHIEKMRAAVKHAVNNNMEAAMTIARGLDEKLGLHGQAPAIALPEGAAPAALQQEEATMNYDDINNALADGEVTEAEFNSFNGVKDCFNDLSEADQAALGLSWQGLEAQLNSVGASDDVHGLHKAYLRMENLAPEQQAAYAKLFDLLSPVQQAAGKDDRAAHIDKMAKVMGEAAGGQQSQHAAALAGSRGPTNDPAQNNAIHHTSALADGVMSLVSFPIKAIMGKVNERADRIEADRIYSKTLEGIAEKSARFDGVQKLVDELKTLPAGAGNARAGEIVNELKSASDKFVNDSQSKKAAEARASADPTLKTALRPSQDDVANDFKEDGKKLGDMIKDAMKAPAVNADPKLKKELEESNEKLAEAMKKILEMIRKLFKAFGSNNDSPKQTVGPGGP